MPGLFDGMRISQSGIQAFRSLQEVVSNNIANSANEDYTRQQGKLVSRGTIFDGAHYYGQGVSLAKIVRVRDELLDAQIRNTHSSSSRYEVLHEWLQRIESTFNEPSEHSIAQGLRNFWGAWQGLTNDPQNLAARSELLKRSEDLAGLLNSVSGKIENLGQQLNDKLYRTVDAINTLTSEIAELNQSIFEIEVGQNGQANDLRDKRDAALNNLSELIDIDYSEASNGMIQVNSGTHPVIIDNKAEPLKVGTNGTDASKLQLVWGYGEYFRGTSQGELAAVQELRETVIPAYLGELDSFTQNFMSEVNRIYSQGTPLQASTSMESRLGYTALGVSSASDSLSLLATGETRTIHFTFHDADDAIVRSHAVLIQSTDSLEDIANKIDSIQGLNASLIADVNTDGRLSITLDTAVGANTRGESGFVVSNNTGAYDTTSGPKAPQGLLQLLGFHGTDKSTNASGVAPVLSSRDLTELQAADLLEEPSLAAVMAHQLNIQGAFTINLFETGTESAGKTDGHHMQQFTINVERTDTITSVMGKINALTADFGVSMSLNGGTNRLELTSSARTSAAGEVVLAGGTDYLRLGFANDYRFPDVLADEAPADFISPNDERTLLSKVRSDLGLFEKLQFNTLFSGENARDIGVDPTITAPELVRAGLSLGSGDNRLALAMVELQNALVIGGNQFSIDESYGNLVGKLGTDVRKHDSLSTNEGLQLQGFIAERDRISGVDLDEELVNMMLFQRAYESNARMFSTFNQMIEELLKL